MDKLQVFSELLEKQEHALRFLQDEFKTLCLERKARDSLKHPSPKGETNRKVEVCEDSKLSLPRGWSKTRPLEIEFSEYCSDVRMVRWACCACGNINAGKRSHCIACDEDVSSHVSVALCSNGKKEAVLFGKKKLKYTCTCVFPPYKGGCPYCVLEKWKDGGRVEDLVEDWEDLYEASKDDHVTGYCDHCKPLRQASGCICGSKGYVLGNCHLCDKTVDHNENGVCSHCSSVFMSNGRYKYIDNEPFEFVKRALMRIDFGPYNWLPLEARLILMSEITDGGYWSSVNSGEVQVDANEVIYQFKMAFSYVLFNYRVMYNDKIGCALFNAFTRIRAEGLPESSFIQCIKDCYLDCNGEDFEKIECDVVMEVIYGVTNWLPIMTMKFNIDTGSPDFVLLFRLVYRFFEWNDGLLSKVQLMKPSLAQMKSVIGNAVKDAFPLDKFTSVAHSVEQLVEHIKSGETTVKHKIEDPKFIGLVETLNSTLKDGVKVSDETKDYIDQKMTDIVSLVKQTVDNLRVFAVDTVIVLVEKLLGLVLCCCAMYVAEDTKTRILIASACAFMSGIGGVVVQTICNAIANLKPAEVVAQAGEEENGLIAGLFEAVTVLVTGKKNESSKRFADNIRDLRGSIGLIKDTKSFIEMIVSVLKSAVIGSYELLTGLPIVQDFQRPVLDDVVRHSDIMAGLMEGDLTQRKKDRKYCRIVVDAGDKANDLLVQMARVKLNVPQFQSLVTSFKVLRERCSAVLRAAQVRNEPVWIHLIGRPGVGKTVLTYQIACDIYNKYGKRLERADFFFRSGESEYWEGYNYQDVVVWDDLFQIDMAESMTSQAMELIRAKNSAVFNLNMAFDKGEYYFDTPLLISSSNLMQLPSKGGALKLADIDALRRRRDFVVTVERRADYKSRENTLDMAAYKFYLCDIMKESQQVEVSYNDLLAKFCELFSVRKTRQSDIVESIFSCQMIPEIVAQANEDLEMSELKAQKSDGKSEEEIPNHQKPPERVAPSLKVEGMTSEQVEISQTRSRDLLDTIKKSGYVPMDKIEFVEKGILIMCTEKCNICAHQGCGSIVTTERGHYVKSVQELAAIMEGRCKCFYHTKMSQVGKMDFSYSKLQKTFRKAKEQFVSFLKQVAESHPLKITLGVIGVAATALISGSLLYKMFNKKEEQSNSAYEGAVHARKSTKANPVAKKFVPRQAQQQGGDLAAENVMSNVIPRNSCLIQLLGKDDKMKQVRGLFIAGRILLTANHVLSYRKDGAPITIVDNIGTYQVAEKSFTVLDDGEDIALVFIEDRRVPEHSNIIHHFITEADFRHSLGEFFCVYVYDKVKPLIRYGFNGSLDVQVQYSTSDGTRCLVAHGIEMNVPTIAGECGAPWIVLNPHISGKIVGLHVAGTGYKGYASMLTREVLEAVMVKAQDGGVMEFPKIELPSQATIERLVPLSEEFHTPGKSRIVPTVLKDVVKPHFSEPARLHPYKKDGVIVDPLANALKKFDIEVADYTDKYEPRVAEYMLQKQSHLVEPRVLTEEEAINGVVGWEYMSKGLSMTTSLGYGAEAWCKNTGGKPGKTSQFTFLEDRWVPSVKIREAMNRMLLGFVGESEKVEVIVTDALKDELRPIAKVDNPRIFNPMPVEHTILMRMFCGAFVENQMRDHIDGTAKVGINPNSSYEWKKLWKMLVKFGDEETRVANGDYSKFDAHQRVRLAHLFISFVNHWYKRSKVFYYSEKLDNLVRYHLIMSCVRSLHLCKNTLYWLQQGNTSGQYLTTFFNCYSAEFILRCAAAEAEDGNFDFVEIQETIGIADFGDDNMMVWPPVFKNISMPFIAEVAKRWGHEYTDFKKTAVMPDYYNWKDIEFLKRAFRKEGDTIFAPLRKEVLYEIPQWRRDTMSEREAMSVLVEVAEREAVQWGREFFDEFKRQHDEALIENGFQPPVVIFDEIVEKYRDGTLQNYGDGIIVAQSGDLDQNREINTPHEKQITLTTFADNTGMSEPLVEELTVVSKIHTDTDPYMDQKLDVVLERIYPVGTFTWSGNDNIGTELFQIDFPDALFQVPKIKTILDTFQYLRAGVEIQIRINGIIFHSGRLLCAWQPHFQQPTTIQNPFQGLYVASSCPHVRISPNTNVTTSFVIPFVGNRDYWNMKDSSTTTARGLFGYVVFFVEHPLRISGATSTPSLEVLVYARFLQPKVSGLGVRTNVVAQMGDVLKEQEKKSEVGTLTGTIKASQNLLANIASFPIMPGPVKSFSRRMIGLGYNIMSLLGKPTSLSETSRTMLLSNTGFALCDGLDGTQKLSMDPKNTVSTDFQLFNSIRNYDLFDEYKLLPSLLYVGSFDSSTPVGTRVFQTGVNPLACFHDNYTGGEYYVKTHLANLAHLFAYWQGSIKYRISFSCSKVLSTRVRLMWLPDPTYTSAIANDQEGDIVSKVVDITGDVAVEFSIPYLREYHWLPVGELDEVNFEPITSWDFWNGQVVMQTVLPVASNVDTGSSVIYFSVWVAGGTDFEVSVPRSINPLLTDGTTTEEEHIHAQMGDLVSEVDMRAAFRNEFAPLIPARARSEQGISMGEKVQSFSQYLKRYSLLVTGDTGSTKTINPTMFANGEIRPWGLINRSFLFNRGSVRVKAVVTTLSSAAPIDWQGVVRNSSPLFTGFDNVGAIVQYGRLSNIFEAEIPFYTQENMNSMTFSGSGEREYPQGLTFSFAGITGAITTIRVDYWISAGDDYTLGWPMVPIVLNLPETKGDGKKEAKEPPRKVGSGSGTRGQRA